MTRATNAFALDATLSLLRKRIAHLLETHASTPTRRIIISLSGVPGSGKSTIAAALLESMQSTSSSPDHPGPRIAVVPMDGYHHPKHTLSLMPDPREAFARRGAPFTFDADAFVDAVIRLKNTPVTETDDGTLGVRLPGFDHRAQDPVPEAIYVGSATRVLVVEGNYLLLDEEPWRGVRGCVDEAWFVDASAEVAKERLIRRHIEAGIETSVEAAAARVESNDLINGELIRMKLIEPDVLIRN